MAFSIPVQVLMHYYQQQALAGNRRLYKFPEIDPFDLSDNTFKNDYRLPKHLVIMLCDELDEYLRPNCYQVTALTTKRKVLCALRFFATGSYQGSVANDFTIKIDRSTVSRVIKQVCIAIQHKLLRKWIKFPTNARSLRNQKLGFYLLAGVPGVIGAIDCTHVEIVSPPSDDPDNPEHIFVNRHGRHSLNVQMVCDANLRILNVNAKYSGASHDSFIWRNCALRRKLQDVCANDNNTWLLGDSGYPLEPWLMTPLSNPANREEEVYNRKHAKTRNPIERCFGVLKARFRCILKDRVLHYRPVAAARIVNACAVLHNICIEHGVEPPDDIPKSAQNDEEEESEEQDIVGAHDVRRTLISLVN